jgi:hypothetical protein
MAVRWDMFVSIVLRDVFLKAQGHGRVTSNHMREDMSETHISGGGHG